MLAQALIAAAFAAPSCDLDAPTFRAAVVDARSALQRDDLETAQHEVDRVVGNLECISFAPESRLWAELMVVVSVIAFAEGEDWESPLAAALRIRPAIDRIVGVVHPMYDWQAPEEVPLMPVVSRNQIYIDGRKVQARPPPQGWYLLQKTDGTAWNTVWKRDEPVDPAWMAAPVVRPPRLAVEVSIGGTLGIGAAGQWRKGFGETTFRSVYDLGWSRVDGAGFEGTSAANVPARFGRPYRVQPMVGLDVGMRLTFFTRLGLSAFGSGMVGIRPYARYLRGMATWAGRQFDVSLGIAVYDLYLARFKEPFQHNADLVYNSAADPEPNPLEPGGGVFYFGMVEVMYSPSDAFRIAARIGIRDHTSQMGEAELRYRARPLARLPEVLQARPFVSAFVRGGYGRFLERDTVGDEIPSLIWSTRMETGLTVGATFGSVP